MSKEWQEASNEYAKVCRGVVVVVVWVSITGLLIFSGRARESILFMVLAVRDTRARDLFKVSLSGLTISLSRRNKAVLFSTT